MLEQLLHPDDEADGYRRLNQQQAVHLRSCDKPAHLQPHFRHFAAESRDVASQPRRFLAQLADFSLELRADARPESASVAESLPESRRASVPASCSLVIAAGRRNG